MKLIAILIAPAVVSFILFVFSLVFRVDFCGSVVRALELLSFSGSQRMGDGVVGCFLYGALVCALFLIFPVSAYIYITLDVEKIRRNANALSFNKLLPANVVISASYFSFFFAPGSSYSEKGEAFVDEIMTNEVLFYLFCIFPCLMMAGMWSLYFKLKINKSSIRR